jgi:2,5-diamino-6-(ribosylamino)-4(3H)-pyrimidinone 5'-phosphate reductase
VHVVLNMAASLDGRVAGPGGQPVQLSGPEDHERVHHLRADSDAIVVGIGTVLADDPRLTARPEPRGPREEQPLRVVVDSRLRTPEDARVLDEAADTLVLASEDGELPGATVVPVGEDQVDLAAGVDALADRGVERVMIEGGPTLAASALAAGLVDRFSVYIAPRVLGEGPSLAEAFQGLDVDLEPRSRAPLGEGTLVNYGVGP